MQVFRCFVVSPPPPPRDKTCALTLFYLFFFYDRHVKTQHALHRFIRHARKFTFPASDNLLKSITTSKRQKKKVRALRVPARTRSNAACGFSHHQSSAKTIPDMLFWSQRLLELSSGNSCNLYIFSRNSRVLFLKRQNKSVNMSDLSRYRCRAPHSQISQGDSRRAQTVCRGKLSPFNSIVSYLIKLLQTPYNIKLFKTHRNWVTPYNFKV